MIWNERIALSFDDTLVSDGTCAIAFGRAAAGRCPAGDLNHSRTPFVAVTLLDEVALLVARYLNPVIGEDLTPNAKLEFEAYSANIFTEAVEARLSLKLQW